MLLEVADVLLFDRVFDAREVGLELGVEVFVVLHWLNELFELIIFYVFIAIGVSYMFR